MNTPIGDENGIKYFPWVKVCHRLENEYPDRGRKLVEITAVVSRVNCDD